MSLENDLQTLLLTKCPRVFPRKAPNGTANPYIIWDRQGGESFVYLDNTSSGKRKPLILVRAIVLGSLLPQTFTGVSNSLKYLPIGD